MCNESGCLWAEHKNIKSMYAAEVFPGEKDLVSWNLTKHTSCQTLVIVGYHTCFCSPHISFPL